jgi:hypothetical protein
VRSEITPIRGSLIQSHVLATKRAAAAYAGGTFATVSRKNRNHASMVVPKRLIAVSPEPKASLRAHDRVGMPPSYQPGAGSANVQQFSF